MIVASDCVKRTQHVTSTARRSIERQLRVAARSGPSTKHKKPTFVDILSGCSIQALRLRAANSERARSIRKSGRDVARPKRMQWTINEGIYWEGARCNTTPAVIIASRRNANDRFTLPGRAPRKHRAGWDNSSTYSIYLRQRTRCKIENEKQGYQYERYRNLTDWGRIEIPFTRQHDVSPSSLPQRVSAARRSWVLRGVAECVAEGARTRGFASLAFARFAFIASSIFLRLRKKSILGYAY